MLEIRERRVYRWYARRAHGALVDKTPGGGPVHGILPEEQDEILALFNDWAR